MACTFIPDKNAATAIELTQGLDKNAASGFSITQVCKDILANGFQLCMSTANSQHNYFHLPPPIIAGPMINQNWKCFKTSLFATFESLFDPLASIIRCFHTYVTCRVQRVLSITAFSISISLSSSEILLVENGMMSSVRRCDS